MLVFIEYEHADRFEREHGQKMLASRTRIRYRLEDLASALSSCPLRPHRPGLLDKIRATAIFISGNSFAPAHYSPHVPEPSHATIRETELPIFAFCGGFQLIAQALGVNAVALSAPDDPSEDLSLVMTEDGRPFEFGYHPVELSVENSGHPLLSGLGRQAIFRHAHGLHVPELPGGFVNLASTATTPIQMAVHNEQPMVGTQFHPEYWTEEHSDGRTVIANFLSWSMGLEPQPEPAGLIRMHTSRGNGVAGGG